MRIWLQLFGAITGTSPRYLDRECHKLNSRLEILAHEITNTLSEAATAIISGSQRSPAEITKILDEVASDLSSKVHDYPHLVVETKRRVAEWKFDLLAGVDCPFKLMADVQQSIRDLGYIDLERETTREIIFARYCISAGKPDIAKSVLANIDNMLQQAMEVDEHGQSEMTPLSKQYFQKLRETVQKLNKDIRR